MCGICGFVDNTGSQEDRRKLIARMVERLVHRGPDDTGVTLADGATLGFARLSIIDPEHGNQPLCNEDGSVHVVCNGEIYNYVELGKELTEKGHRLSCGSDAEVIAHLYEDHGDAFVNRLRGMFAIALWDDRRSELLLVRDRLGIKPLHYSKLPDGRLLFASEQKAILADCSVSREPDRPAMWELFALGFVSGDKTLFSRIRRVLPGQILRFKAGKLSAELYWQLGLAANPAGETRKASDWADEVRAQLEECVKIHLRSDVPVAAWLSPGIDSSSIVALTHRLGVRIPQTFTLACEDPDIDETAENPVLTSFPGYEDIPNETVVLKNVHFEWLPDAVLHCEDPFTSAAEIARMVLAKASAADYKVVLTGEGSDEAFGGYAWFRTEKLLRPMRHLPAVVRRAIANTGMLRRKWPGGCNILSGLGTRMGFDRYRAFIGPPTFPEVGISLFSHDFLRHLPRKTDKSVIEGMKRIVPGDDDFLHLQALDLAFRLPDCIAQHLDRATMAYGLEARVPFLDHQLMELCAKIPPGLKLKGRCEKHVLRRAMEDILPKDITWRRKRAMSAPYANWLRAPLPEFAREYLSPSRLEKTGYFAPAKVQELLEIHRSGRADHGRILLGVLCIQLWDRLLREGKPA